MMNSLDNSLAASIEVSPKEVEHSVCFSRAVAYMCFAGKVRGKFYSYM